MASARCATAVQARAPHSSRRAAVVPSAAAWRCPAHADSTAAAASAASSSRRLALQLSLGANGTTAAATAASSSRRLALLSLGAAALAASPLPAAAAAAAAAAAPGIDAKAVEALQRRAAQAYADREFQEALDALDALVSGDPLSLQWREMRAQLLVDAKAFSPAIADFNWVLKRLPAEGGASGSDGVERAGADRARLLAGRALALEGLGDWPAALDDYSQSLRVAEAAGLLQDPYILNSRGNCHVSLGEWAAARADFLASADGFLKASGYRYGRSTSPRLDGAVFASSNAALMLAQLGDEEGAVREMQAIARKAPGSVDMRAALAALYWHQGREEDAEAAWNFACTNITTGCTKYQDADWVSRIRRWPPVMARYLQDFLKLESRSRSGGGGGSSNGGSAAAAGRGFRE